MVRKSVLSQGLSRTAVLFTSTGLVLTAVYAVGCSSTGGGKNAGGAQGSRHVF